MLLRVRSPSVFLLEQCLGSLLIVWEVSQEAHELTLLDVLHPELTIEYTCHRVGLHRCSTKLADDILKESRIRKIIIHLRIRTIFGRDIISIQDVLNLILLSKLVHTTHECQVLRCIKCRDASLEE